MKYKFSAMDERMGFWVIDSDGRVATDGEEAIGTLRKLERGYRVRSLCKPWIGHYFSRYAAVDALVKASK